MKRSAALLLAVLMLCSIFPAEVFADSVLLFDGNGNVLGYGDPNVYYEENPADFSEGAVQESTAVAEAPETSVIPAQPAETPDPFSYLTGYAEDSTVFTAYGLFPEGTSMVVTPCEIGEKLMKKVFTSESAEKITAYKAYNISFEKNGEEYDPDMTLQLSIVPNMDIPVNRLSASAYSPYESTIAKNEDGVVLSEEQVSQMKADGEEDKISYVSETFYTLFDLDVKAVSEKKIEVWTDQYRPLVLYREGFDYAPMAYTLTAGQEVLLSDMLKSLNLGLGLEDIAQQGIRYLGDPEQVKLALRERDGDWNIWATKTFYGSQILELTFSNGGVLNVALNCGEEYQGTEEPESDKETFHDWEEMFRNVELTGKWPEDVVTIALTQLGYAFRDVSRNPAYRLFLGNRD